MRERAKKNCGAERLIGLPVRTSLAFMPRWSVPEHTRTKAMRSRWFGSMLAWILKTKDVIFGSVASTRRVSASCARGGGAQSPSASIRSRTPKLRSAEPKKTGVRWPSRKAFEVERPAGLARQLQLLDEGRRARSRAAGRRRGWNRGR